MIFTDLVAYDIYSEMPLAAHHPAIDYTSDDYSMFKGFTEIVHKAYRNQTPVHNFKRSATDAASAMLNSADAITSLVDHLIRPKPDSQSFYEVSLRDIRASYADVFDSLKNFDLHICGSETKHHPTSSHMDSMAGLMMVKSALIKGDTVTHEDEYASSGYFFMERHNLTAHSNYAEEATLLKSALKDFPGRVPADYKRFMNTLYTMRNPACNSSLLSDMSADYDRGTDFEVIKSVERDYGFFHFKQLIGNILYDSAFDNDDFNNPDTIVYQNMHLALVLIQRGVLQNIHPAVIKMSDELGFVNYENSHESRRIAKMYDYALYNSLNSAMRVASNPATASFMDLVNAYGSKSDFISDYGLITTLVPNLYEDKSQLDSSENDKGDYYKLIFHQLLPGLSVSLIESFKVLVALSFDALLDSADEFTQSKLSDYQKPKRKRVDNPRKFDTPTDAYETVFTPAVRTVEYNITGALKQSAKQELARSAGASGGSGYKKARHYVRPHFAVLSERVLKSGEVKPKRTILRKGHWRGTVDVVKGTVVNVL